MKQEQIDKAMDEVWNDLYEEGNTTFSTTSDFCVEAGRRLANKLPQYKLSFSSFAMIVHDWLNKKTVVLDKNLRRIQ